MRSTQSDQGIYCPLTKSFGTTDWMESKDRMILCVCTGWSKPAHSAHVGKHFFRLTRPIYTGMSVRTVRVNMFCHEYFDLFSYNQDKLTNILTNIRVHCLWWEKSNNPIACVINFIVCCDRKHDFDMALNKDVTEQSVLGLHDIFLTKMFFVKDCLSRASCFQYYLFRFDAKLMPSLHFSWTESSLHALETQNMLVRNNFITKTCLFKYIENFTTKKEKFQILLTRRFNEYPQSVCFVH